MMKKHIKNITAVLISLIVVLGLTACGSKSPSGNKAGSTGSEEKDLKKITFCLDWTPNTNHTGVYAAQALGYYEKAGLDVEIVQPPENGALTMCASGQAQFAVDAQDTMAAAIDGDEPLGITAVAGLVQHNSSGILSRKGDGIDRPKGLEGKSYSTWEIPTELKMMEYVVAADGGDFSKVKLIPNDITDEPAALAAGQTDAVWVFYGWSGINADIEGVPVGHLIVVLQVLVVFQALGDTEIITAAKHDRIRDSYSYAHSPLSVNWPNAGIGFTCAEGIAPNSQVETRTCVYSQSKSRITSREREFQVDRNVEVITMIGLVLLIIRISESERLPIMNNVEARLQGQALNRGERIVQNHSKIESRQRLKAPAFGFISTLPGKAHHRETSAKRPYTIDVRDLAECLWAGKEQQRSHQCDQYFLHSREYLISK